MLLPIEPSEAWIYGRDEAEVMQMRRNGKRYVLDNLRWAQEKTRLQREFAEEMSKRKLHHFLPKYPPGS